MAGFAAFIAMNAETARVNFWPLAPDTCTSTGRSALSRWSFSSRVRAALAADACAAGGQAPHRQLESSLASQAGAYAPRPAARCGPTGIPPVSNPIYLALDLPRLDAAIALGQKERIMSAG
jgi:hypothetical protein